MGFFLRPDQRHLNLRMTIDHRFDFLRMDLQASDIDDAIPPADEIIAVAAQFEHVAGIDEAVRVREMLGLCADVAGAMRGERIRSEPSSTFISTPTALLSIRLAGKPARPSRDFECNARLRRGESVGDSGLRVEGPEMVQDRLVRDFSGQTDILGRNHVAPTGSSERGANGKAFRRYG